MVKSTPHSKTNIIHTTTPAGHGSATSHASTVNGQWLSVQAQEAINKMRVHRAFDNARDPLLAEQLKDADTGKTESQRRGEAESGEQKRRQIVKPTTQHGLRRKGERLRQADHPQPKLKGWLKAQARAAMASVPEQIAKPVRDDGPKRKPANNNPKQSRGRNRSRDGPQPTRPYHGPSI